ncbi:IFT57 [Bugula neritina]|uniref:IFT57 n=1 Tax=Bugula neritina TaxID=10212 RepID=A0A7J7KKM7_BUGNE|nr:IFT57 [Bugula neritina]
MADDFDDEFGEEESLLDLNALKNQKHDSTSKPENIMVSNTTAAEWKLELERVLPQLKVTIRTDNKDWRQHVEQMHSHSEGIEKSLSETKTLLNRLHEEITKTLDKIATREKVLEWAA